MQYGLKAEDNRIIGIKDGSDSELQCKKNDLTYAKKTAGSYANVGSFFIDVKSAYI